MEKTITAIFYVISIMVLALLLVQIMQSKKKNTFELMLMSLLGMFMNGAVLLAIIMEDKTAMSFVYTAVLMLEGWILLLFLRYAYKRTLTFQNQKKYLK